MLTALEQPRELLQHIRALLRPHCIPAKEGEAGGRPLSSKDRQPQLLQADHRVALGDVDEVIDVVARYVATDWHAAVCVEVRDHRLQNVAPDILKVDVNAIGADLLDRISTEALGLVVYAGVEPELIGAVAALRWAAGNANDVTAGNLRQLPHDLPHRPAGRRHHDRLSRLRRTDVHQAMVRRVARHAEDPQRRRRLSEIRVPLLDRHVLEIPLHVLRGGDLVLRPSVVANHQIADRPALAAALDHLGHGAPNDGRTDGSLRVHVLGAHVGVEREIFRLKEHLARRERWQRLADDLKVLGHWLAVWVLQRQREAVELGQSAPHAAVCRDTARRAEIARLRAVSQRHTRPAVRRGSARRAESRPARGRERTRAIVTMRLTMGSLELADGARWTSRA